MATSLLSIGTQALTANQTTLSYVGQNIANANTEGYSRQNTTLQTQTAGALGVKVESVTRIANEFMTRQIWADSSAYGSTSAFTEKMTTLDNLLISESSSLSGAIDEFFASLQQVVDDPTYVANRQLFLAQAETLSGSFNNMNERLSQQEALLNTELDSVVSSMNSVTESIAQLNLQITAQNAAGQSTHELLDQRDTLVKQLSGYASVSVMETDNGDYNITLANGQPLVVAGAASVVELREGIDPNSNEIYISVGSGNSRKVSDQFGEGQIGGLIRYRDEVLHPAMNEIGRLAIVFTETMNEQHRKGVDMNGDMGQDLFNIVSEGTVYFDSANTRTSIPYDLTFYDSSSLTASDYRLIMSNDDTFAITRISDGQVFRSDRMTELDGTETGPVQSNSFEYSGGGLTINLDGFTLSLDQIPAYRDQLLIEPTRSGARNMSVRLTDPQMLALASPISVDAASTNTGTVSVSNVAINTTSDTSILRQGNLPSYELSFNSDGTYSAYELNDDGTRTSTTPVIGPQAYVAGEEINFGDFSVTLDNEPNAGDRFTFSYNADGVGDNTNALAMSNLQNSQSINGYSYQDSYGQLISWVGTQASSATTLNNANEAALESSENALQSVSGVNLDEEAAKLVQFQQAYSASARLISAFQQMFDDLVGAMR